MKLRQFTYVSSCSVPLPQIAFFLLFTVRDWWYYLGPIKVGMWYLLMSIVVQLNLLFCFTSEKGAYISRYWMPEEYFWICFCCLACHMKGLTLADARCPSLNKYDVDFIKMGMVRTLATIQNRLDLYHGISMRRFIMEGMLEGEWEDVQPLLLVLTVFMVPPSLFPIFLLRTPFPNTLGSTKRSQVLHLLFYFVYVQSATLSLIA